MQGREEGRKEVMIMSSCIAGKGFHSIRLRKGPVYAMKQDVRNLFLLKGDDIEYDGIDSVVGEAS